MLGECQHALILAPGKYSHRGKSAATARMNVSKSWMPPGFILDVVWIIQAIKMQIIRRGVNLPSQHAGLRFGPLPIALLSMGSLPAQKLTRASSWAGRWSAGFSVQVQGKHQEPHWASPTTLVCKSLLAILGEVSKCPLWATGKDYSVP